MASHVVVLDSSARRATVKTTPDKYLTDILREACAKLGRSADSYGLKHNNKPLDLSRNVRLAGLSSGAKLQLVLSSRSPSVVSVALQLPEPDSRGSTRLTDKFPSSTTVWMVLRKFESAPDGVKQNYTGRGIPVPHGQGGGAGRLYFETPVIQSMGRELSSFTDFQKTLAQIGFNSGTALLKMSFRRTETPLEEAMQEIEQYFSEAEAKAGGDDHGDAASRMESTPGSSDPIAAPDIVDQPSPPEPISSMSPKPSSQIYSPKPTRRPSSTEATDPQVLAANDMLHRPVTVFAPPSSDTPKAAQQPFNEKDYDPTIDHAKLHQLRLAATGVNRRLPSDAELAAQAELQAQRHAKVKEIEIKVRFPDQMQAVSKFSDTDTANALYDFVRGLMVSQTEPFSLRYSAPNGPKNIPSGSSGNVKLVSGLGIMGRVLVNVVWEEGASLEARGAPILKDQYREKAQEIEVKQIQGSPDEEKLHPFSNTGVKEGKERKGGVPKWLKLPGKK